MKRADRVLSVSRPVSACSLRGSFRFFSAARFFSALRFFFSFAFTFTPFPI